MLWDSSIAQTFKNCAFVIFSYGFLRPFELVLRFAVNNPELNITMRFQNVSRKKNSVKTFTRYLQYSKEIMFFKYYKYK